MMVPTPADMKVSDRRVVHTTREVRHAITAGEPVEYVGADALIVKTGEVWVSGPSFVVCEGDAIVWWSGTGVFLARGNATVHLVGTGEVCAKGSATIFAPGHPDGRFLSDGKVFCNGQTTVHAGGAVWVKAYGSDVVTITEGARARVSGSVVVYASDHSSVMVPGAPSLSFPGEPAVPLSQSGVPVVWLADAAKLKACAPVNVHGGIVNVANEAKDRMTSRMIHQTVTSWVAA